MTVSIPKVTVIILVYNAEFYLRKCIESVINQSLKDIEVIIVNDGSTDNSLQIINEYAERDGRIRILSHTNRGVSYSANRGLSDARGKYLYVCANDDYLTENGLEEIYNIANDLNLDILSFDVFLLYDIDGTIKRKIDRRLMLPQQIVSGLEFYEIMMTKKCAFWPEFFFLFRVDFLSENNIVFCDEATLNEDMIFVPRALLLAQRVAYRPLAPYVWRKRSNSISQSPYSIKKLHNHLVIAEQLSNFMLHSIEHISTRRKSYNEFKNLIIDHYLIIIKQSSILNANIPQSLLQKQIDLLAVENHFLSPMLRRSLSLFFKHYTTFKGAKAIWLPLYFIYRKYYNFFKK